MEAKFKELKDRLQEANDLEMAGALLGWDQSTYMPEGGGPARARQSATLGRLAQEKFTDPAIGRLLDDLRSYEESLPYESDEASLIRVTRRQYERMVRVPSEFMGRLYQHSAETFQVWAQARPADDFGRVQPYLEKTLDLSRELAGYFPGYQHIADPLIEFSDYGMTVATLRDLFGRLRAELVPIVQAIAAQAPADSACLHKEFSPEAQMEFAALVVKQLGYDFSRGRLDKTHHPFTTKFSLGDVRITTRTNTHDLSDCLFSTIHEAGHAMYEQGIRRELEGSPLAGGTSSGVHESQSRLWENIVGRSRGFWQYFYPQLQAVFANQCGSLPLDSFYRAINKVEKSLIRTEADEVTYNLHVMLRFDLELAMLEGQLAIRDLPEAWNDRFAADFGFRPADLRNGVLQDVHWFSGSIGGAFQGYTIGNILAAQFYEKAVQAQPAIPEEIARGQFDTLRGWLTENIYQHGSKFTPAELIQRATGGPIRIEPYIRYLKTKYGELYNL